MKKLKANTTSEALAYLQKYKVQNPIEIEFKHLKNPLPTKLLGKTDLMDIKPNEILTAIDLDHIDIREWVKTGGQWFSLKQYKGAKKKADKPSDNMLALLLDPTAAKKFTVTAQPGFDFSKSWALIGGSGKGVATMNKAKLNEVLHDKDPTYDFTSKSLAQFLADLKNRFPGEIADGTILHLGMTSTLPGKESVVQIIHDEHGNIIPIMIVDNERSANGPIVPAGYIVCRYNNTTKLFELTSEPEPFKARNKIEYRLFNGAPTPSVAHDLVQIDVSGWSSTQLAACIKSWLDIGTGMGVLHSPNRTRQIEEVNGSTIYVRGTSISKGDLNSTHNYISIRELGGKA